MSCCKNLLNKNCLLINKKTFTDDQNQIIKIENDFYIHRKLYILAKSHILKIPNKNQISFYLKTKKISKKDISYAKPLIEDIIIKNYRELITLVINFLEMKDINHYKIMIFNDSLNFIEGNEQLMNYKNKILYAKINENIKKEETEKNINFRIIDNTSNKIALSYNNKDNNIKKLFSAIKPTFLKFRPKKNNINNHHHFNKNFRNFLLDKTSINSQEKNINNTFNQKFFFNKKLKKISLKYHQNNSFQFKNSENESKIKSFNDSQNSQSKIFPSKIYSKININRHNNDIKFNEIITTVRLNKSRSDFEKYGNIKEKLRQQVLDGEKIFGNKNYKNEGMQCSNEDLSFNKTKSHLYTNIFNNIIKKHSYSALFCKNKNKSFYQEKNNSFTNSYLGEINKTKKNYTSLYNRFFKKNPLEFKHLKTIFKYLKYPKLKDENDYNENDFVNKNEMDVSLYMNKIKGLYDECIYEIRVIINNINYYFPDISHFYQQINLLLKEKCASININECLKHFIFYCYLESSIKEQNYTSLKDIFNLPLNENSYKIKENFLSILLKSITSVGENNSENFKNYIDSKKNLEEFILTKDFFFPFIFCSNIFNKTQRDIGKRMLMVLDIEDNLNFDKYANYHLIFKDNKSLSFESKLNFINKFLIIVDSGCFSETGFDSIKKFGNEVQFIFSIDNRIKKQLLNDNKNAKMNNSQIKKINEIFFSMINFF